MALIQCPGIKDVTKIHTQNAIKYPKFTDIDAVKKSLILVKRNYPNFILGLLT